MLGERRQRISTRFETQPDGGDAVLYVTSRTGNRISVFDIGTTGPATRIDQQSLSDDTTALEIIDIDGVAHAVALGPANPEPMAFRINANGTLDNTGTTLLNAAQNEPQTLTQTQTAGGAYLYAATDAGVLMSYRQTENGDVQAIQAPALPDGASRLLAAESGSGQYLIVASADAAQVTSYEVLTDGSLQVRATLGAAQGLGVTGVSALTQVNLPDGEYIVVAAQGSSSLSVMRLGENGSLTATDQVIDDLNTRFQSVIGLDVVTLGDQVFVVVGGGDDGVSIFALLPGGTLLHMASLADDFNMTLDNVSSVAAIAQGGLIQIFVGSETEASVTQLSFDPGPLGDTLLGTSGNDLMPGTGLGEILWGGAGDDFLRGRGGDDIVMDGAGQDRLEGGGGRDVFVLSADGQYDRIMDFTPGEDSIDLSSWPMQRNVGQISFIQTVDGARMMFADEELRIYSADGQPLSAAQILTPSLINQSRIPTGSATIQADFVGSAAADRFVGNDDANYLSGAGGADSLFGGDGSDTLDGDGGNDLLHGETEDSIYDPVAA